MRKGSSTILKGGDSTMKFSGKEDGKGGDNGDGGGSGKSRYIPEKQKNQIRERDGNKCVYCGKNTNTEKENKSRQVGNGS